MQAISLLLVWCAWMGDARAVGNNELSRDDRKVLTPLQALSESLLAVSPTISKKRDLGATRRGAPVRSRRAPKMASVKELRRRVKSVQTSIKITSSMRMVAAAKVAKASDLNAEFKPNIVYTQNMVDFLKGKLGDWQNEIPIVAPRKVKKVLLIATSGDRGLCGGFNSKAIKKVVQRKAQLEKKGLKVELVAIGEKVRKYLGRRYDLRAEIPLGKPAAEDCQEWIEQMSPWLVEGYLNGDYDKVEIIYTQFISMISCEPTIKTILPYTEVGSEEELAELTSEDGELDVQLDVPPVPEGEEFMGWKLELDQSPDFLVEWMGEMFLTSALLTTQLETFASELSSRVLAMQTATDNAEELSAKLIQLMNRKRQGRVTQEMCEIAGGAIAFDDEA